MKVRASMRDGKFYFSFRCDYCGVEHAVQVEHYDLGSHDELEIVTKNATVIEGFPGEQIKLFKD